jgi:hypothetical protein
MHLIPGIAIVQSRTAGVYQTWHTADATRSSEVLLQCWHASLASGGEGDQLHRKATAEVQHACT